MSERGVAIMALASGNGTNLQALIDAEREGRLGPGKIRAVLADNGSAGALERARKAGIEVLTELPRRDLPPEERRRELSDRILARALERDIDLLILAGFLTVLRGGIIRVYENRIINLHPSLLPRFGGEGMYGERVHRAALAAGETESGCTVHLVDAGTDTGPILLQRRVPVLPGDSPETLAARIHLEEHIAIVEAAVLMAERLAGAAGD